MPASVSRTVCVANVTASRISPEKMRKIRVFQEGAYLSLDYQAQAGEIYRLVDGQITRESVAMEKEEPLKRELQSFVECARRGLQPLGLWIRGDRRVGISDRNYRNDQCVHCESAESLIAFMAYVSLF